MTIDSLCEQKRRRVQTTLYGQEKGHYENCNTSSGKNTKTSSPGEEADHNRAGAESSGSSPEKNQNEMSFIFLLFEF